MAYLVRDRVVDDPRQPPRVLSQATAIESLVERTGRDRDDVAHVIRGLRNKLWVTLWPPLKGAPEGARAAQVRRQ